jgi:predicted AlkP superfamily phosphohydrolase/phosphomutase
MGIFKRNKRRRRVCVVGLDGVPHSLLTKLVADGVLPSVGTIISRGSTNRMQVSIPEISSVSWSSFMTGTNPGRHGIFGFVDLKDDGYKLRFPSFRDLRTPTFWDRLGERRKRCVVINQPSTYPARPFPGILISGFVAIDLKKAVFPSEILKPLEDDGYQIDVDTAKARRDHDFLFQDLDRTLKSRWAAVERFWKEEWDYFQVVFTGTDRVQHYLWNCVADESHPYRTAFLDYYRKIDGLIGKLYDMFGQVSPGNEGQDFYMLSDHGFTQIEREVHLNAWLQEQGYLSLEEGSSGLEGIVEGSAAFALDPGRVFINEKGRFSKGAVPAAAVDDLRGEIAGKLMELAFEDKPVIREVFTREQVYNGPYVGEAADLLILSQYGFDLKGSLKPGGVFRQSDLQGMHTWDDAFFWWSGPQLPNLHIESLAELITEGLQ